MGKLIKDVLTFILILWIIRTAWGSKTPPDLS